MPSNLDQFGQSTRFLGRENELAQATSILLDPECRLLTLIGVGGVGKTRLALELAKAQRTQFEDGTWFVNLQPLQSGDQIVSAVMDAVGVVPSGQDALERQLLRYLREKKTLLLLDNFEHLMDGVGVVAWILENAPRTKILVTSRESLRLPTEWLFTVEGLNTPKSHQIEDLETVTAVELFLDRAKQVQPSLSVAEERASIVRLCQLVEGLPLALELAASWTRTLRCAEIVAEIQSNLDFLSSTLRQVPDRHRSMQAVFAQTWELLPDAEKTPLKKLAVFRGGFQREAAAKIAQASLPFLSSLLNKSLLRREPNGRLGIHELLRQFVEAKLDPDELETLEEAHCQYYCSFLAERKLGTVELEQVNTTQEIETELENIRIAWRHAVDLKSVELLRLASPSYFYFCQIQSRYLESARASERALAVFEEADDQKWIAQTLVYLGWMLIRIGRFEQASDGLERSRAIFREHDLDPEYGMGSHPSSPLIVINTIQGKYARAVEVGEELKARSLALDDHHNLSFACYGLIGAYLKLGQLDQALIHAHKALRTAEKVGNHWFSSYCHIELGNVHQAMEDYDKAERHFRAALRIKQAYRDPEGTAVIAHHLGALALLKNDLPTAHDFFERSLSSYKDLNDRGGLATAHHGLGQVAIRKQEYRIAAAHLNQSLEIASKIGFLPLILSLFIDIGALFDKNDMGTRSEELLRMAQDHPASSQQQQEKVRTRMDINPPTRGRSSSDLQSTISALLAELDNFEPIPRPTGQSPLTDPLTPREKDVLRLLNQGMTNPAIAEELTISVGTVKAHTHRIYGKLGVTNRVEAVNKAFELSLNL